MKAMYFGLDAAREAATGGEVIRNRNLEFIRDLYGPDKVIVYRHVRPRVSPLLRWLYLFVRDLAGEGLFKDRALERAVKENDVDVLFIDGTVGSKFTKRFLKEHRTICFFHNVEFDYYRGEAKNFLLKDSSPLRLIHRLQSMLSALTVYRNERQLCRNSGVTIALNKRDSRRLARLYGRAADLILPVSLHDRLSGSDIPAGTAEKADSNAGEDPGGERTASEEEIQAGRGRPYLLFVGSDFFGNTEGLFRFIEQCMPQIACPLVVAGTGMEKYAGLLPADKVKFLGYVRDLGPLYEAAAAVVLPIAGGAGMKVKTCEALMYGKVIFGSRESFEGYDAEGLTDAVLCESDEAFVRNINTYLEEGPRTFSAANRALFLSRFEHGAVRDIFVRYALSRGFTEGGNDS